MKDRGGEGGFSFVSGKIEEKQKKEKRDIN